MKPQANANFASLGKRQDQRTEPQYLTYRRQWSENPAQGVLRHFPLHLDIEATSRCNLDCTFCDKRPVLGQADIGDLDFALFAKIMAEAKEQGLYGLKFSYRGEPLLHPRLPEMVRLAKESGVLDVYFNTNAMLLTEDLAEALVLAGLDRISVSIEGTDPAAYEAERRGADFATVLRNLRGLAAVRERLKSATPRIRVQTVRLPGLDLDAYARFWLAHADEAGCVDFNDVRNRRKGLAAHWACPQLWQRMTITFDGRVMACNNDDFCALSPGNANRRSIRECWTDPAVMEARSLHRQGLSHLVAACDGCPWRTTQIEKERRGQTHGGDV